ENATKKIIVPNFLIEDGEENITNRDIFNSLNLISEYLSKNILIPNNINFPYSRNNFIKHFK
ncbi:DNA repair protein RecO, partial [Candidatus Pelagibacter sp.]|nr:DNA repair protein RecO [Candidatus Pelagibacter sp.]